MTSLLRDSPRAPATTTAAAKFHRPEGAPPFAFRAFGWGRTDEGVAMTVATEILASARQGLQAAALSLSSVGSRHGGVGKPSKARVRRGCRHAGPSSVRSATGGVGVGG